MNGESWLIIFPDIEYTSLNRRALAKLDLPINSQN